MIKNRSQRYESMSRYKIDEWLSSGDCFFRLMNLGSICKIACKDPTLFFP
mgnify:CR=1 FL=1